MIKIKCDDLTHTGCDFVAEGETTDEAKANFYKHGDEAPIHKEMMEKATEESKIIFAKKVDEHLESKE